MKKTDSELAELLRQKVSEINGIMVELVGRDISVKITEHWSERAHFINQPDRIRTQKFVATITKTERL